MDTERTKHPAFLRKLVIVVVALALIFLGGKILLPKYVMIAGGRPVLLSQDMVDLRDAPLTIEEYEALSARMPGKAILWNIPLGGEYYDSTSEHITIHQLSQEDIGTFRYFPNLKTVDATACRDYEALTALEQTCPALDIRWVIHIGGCAFSRNTETLDLREVNVTAQELMDTLGYFSQLPQVQIRKDSLTEAEKQAVTDAFPGLRVFWFVELMGETLTSDAKELSWVGKAVDPDALISAADQFEDVQRIDVSGCGLTLQELLQVQQAYPSAQIISELELYGVSFTTEARELDFSGINMGNTEEIEAALRLMPNLRKVIMSDCGFTNEQMDALNRRHENVLFVWTVHFSFYSLRTDILGFCASDLPYRGYIAPRLTSKALEPLKYCTELIALDLGHMYYADLSFLQNMHKLEYLILVDASYHDISVLAQMKNLKYLELFNNQIYDLSPLLECKNLKHLNVGHVQGFDYTVLTQMTWLERLWFPGHRLDDSQKQTLIDALPDTLIYMPRFDTNGSTGGDWRKADVYYEMRDFFGMFYQPAGTGME